MASFNEKTGNSNMGILAVDKTGTIVFINSHENCIAGIGDDLIGRGYDEIRECNGGFYNMINQIYNCENKTLSITEEDGSILSVSMEKADGKRFFFFKTEMPQAKNNLPTVVLTSMLSVLCIWISVYMCWESTGRPISKSNMSLLVFLPALIIYCVISGLTGIKLKDLRSERKNIGLVLITDAVVAVIAVSFLALSKYAALKFFPGVIFSPEKPFFDFTIFRRLPILYYPLSVVAQEFASRSVMHELLRKCYCGKKGELISVFVSTLVFGIFHIHMGFSFMIFAMIFLGVFGMIYIKQKTIWGLCIIHYALGIAATMLGWIG